MPFLFKEAHTCSYSGGTYLLVKFSHTQHTCNYFLAGIHSSRWFYGAHIITQKLHDSLYFHVTSYELEKSIFYYWHHTTMIPVYNSHKSEDLMGKCSEKNKQYLLNSNISIKR